MTSFIVGALGLVLLQTAISSPLTAPRLGQLGTDLSHAIARFVDPTVPLIGSTATTSSTTSAPSAAVLSSTTSTVQSQLRPV